MPERLTNTSGSPIADNQNSLTAGPHGPILLQDHQLLEKLAHQNRERVPERVVHAKGWGAFGVLTVTHDITRYTRAEVFSAVGKRTPCLFRLSNVAGEMGATAAMGGVPRSIIERQLAHFDRADPASGGGVRSALAETEKARRP